MEVYTLDGLLRRTDVFDEFETIIWTQRWQEKGDFELHIESTPANRKRLTAGTKLALDKSDRVMEIEDVTDSTNEDGVKTLKIVGPEILKVLEDRLVKASNANLAVDSKWTITDKPANVLRKVFTDICITGTLSLNDKIPFIQPGSIYPEDTIPEPQDVVTVDIEPQEMYEFFNSFCKTYDLGMRLVRHGDASQLYFDIYSGSDRTTSQSLLPPVVFAPELDNLQNTTEFTTYKGHKNVAYVYNTQGYVEVLAPGADPDVNGFDRKVAYVKADDLPGTPTEAEINAFLTQKGLEELLKNRPMSAFDGEINQNSIYQYGIDYELGDIVEQRNTDGATNRMRVTEQIFASDKEGDRAYPTLSTNLFITSGSWLAWEYNRVWSELGLTEYWGNAP